jgi:hypothetical protein
MGLTEGELLYGAWAPLTPSDARELLDGLRWWVAGGWALQLATGVERQHEDVDVAVPRSDLALVVERLAGHHLWTAHHGALRPLARFDELPPEYEQLWVRRNAQSPWMLDLLLQPTEGDDWVYKKDARIRVPMDQAVLTSDGVPYLAPQIVLLHKAHLCRPKDEADLDATLPFLSGSARTWLRDAVALAQPASPWNARLAR